MPLPSKLERLRELIELKLRTDTELAQILGDSEKPRRGRRPKENKTGEPEPSEPQDQ